MNCSEIQPWLTSYLLGDLTPESEAEIKAHIDTCEACRAAVREIEPTLGLLRDALAASSKAAEQLSSSRRERVLREGVAPKADRRTGWLFRAHPVFSRAALWVASLGIVAVLFGLTLLRPMHALKSSGQYMRYDASAPQLGLDLSGSDKKATYHDSMSESSSGGFRMGMASGDHVISREILPFTTQAGRPAAPSAGPAGLPPVPPAPPAVRIPSPPKSAPKALPGRGAGGGGGDTDKMYDLSIDVVDAEERPAAIREITGGRAGGSRDRVDTRAKEDVASPTADKPQEMVPATPSIKDLPILGRVNRRPEERGYPSAGGTMGAVADEDQEAPEKSKVAAESPADPFAQNVAKDGQNALSSDRFWATGSKGEAADEETQRWQELKEQNNELRQMAKELKDAVREIHESPAGGDRDGDRLESLGKAFNYDPQKPSPGDLHRMEETKAELVQQIDDYKKSIKKLTEVSVDSRGAGQPVTPEEKWVRGSQSLSVPKEGSGVPAVTFGARYISLRETLNIVTQMSGLKWFAAADGIHVVPANAPDGDVVEREINATPALTESIARDKAINSRNVQEKLKRLFGEMGVKWPAGSFITFVPSLGKLMVANTANGITLFEEKLSMLNDAEPSAPDPRFKAFGVNPFVDTAVNNFSTFGIDVDTASYTLARNYMQKGFLPPAESVRTEEFVNFFDHAYRPPERGLFAIYTEAAPSKFGHGLSLLKIGVKGRRLGREEQRQAVLTFVIDTSGSMNQPDRMGLIKKSLRMLVERLNPADQVAIVQYDSHARLLLEHTPASEKQRILAVIDAMECGGSTNLEEGMSKAYEIAARDFVSKAENRVLLLSDGVANLGTETADDILKNVEKYRQQGILCSVIGVGMGTYDDTMLESLANKGDGTYNFIDSEDEARRVFVDDLAATLNTIAKDVKIQVEFNPRRVARYRQMGYENRQLKKEQFRDDTVDAGEVGSGQSVTALYEMDVPDGVRTTAATSDSSMGDDVLAIVRVRYRDLATGKVEEIEQPVMATEMNSIFDEASPRFRLAACVAEFAEILRGSPFADGSTFPDLARVLRPVALELNLDKQVREVTRMVENAEGMSRGE